MSVVNSGSTVRLTLSGATAGSAVIRVPLQVRSNTGFRISGTFESSTARLAQLSVMDVRATGRLVSPEAVDNLEITEPFDLRGQREKTGFGRRRECFSFHRVKWTTCFLGGTLNSLKTRCKQRYLFVPKLESVGDWLAHLAFFA